jgi:DNA-directed RNA polymerase subunit RPC12/RpoP
MKKFIAILLALIVVLSTSVVAFAADVYTCPTCNKKYTDIDTYNKCIEAHEDAANAGEETVTIYECATCGKKFEDIDAYNECVGCHFNNVNHHYDKYVDATIIEVLSSLIDIFNNTGIKDLFMNIFEKVYTLIIGAVEAA